jgi:Transketolase, thiamine diphosphate binding domain
MDAPTSHDVPHRDLANAIRALAMDAVEKANSGHPGMPMGMADIATVLFGQFLKFDPAHPDWPDRDRFVLSNGHGSMLLYAVLYLTGYPEMTMEGIPNMAMRRVSRRPPARWARASPMPSAWRWPSACWRPSSARTSSITAPMPSPATDA